MNICSRIPGLVFALVVQLSGSAFAAEKADDRGAISEKDYKFVSTAALEGMLEVKAGELARVRGLNPLVKQFGERMVADHTRIGEELKDWASKRGAKMPAQLDTKQRRHLEHLEKLTGREFDTAYASAMVEDHQADLKEYLKAANSADDTDLRVFAAKTVSVIREHLALARNVESSVKSDRATPIDKP